jgi:GntR family histidine utilization transcriptional repressor
MSRSISRSSSPTRPHLGGASPEAAAPAGDAAAGAGLALYQRVKDHIVRHIQDGSWPAGQRIPSEHELVAQFGYSRMTINRALRELAEQGRVLRVAGVGSFVAKDRPQSNLLQISQLAEEVRQRGHSYHCQVVQVERVAATLEQAAALNLETGASVFHAVCVHLENEVPVQLEDRYVSPQMAPDFLQQDFSRLQPSDYLVRHVPYDEMEHVIDAVLPSLAQAELLRIEPAQPCLLLTRRTWLRGQPVTLVRCLHPGSRYRLGSRFRTDGHPLAS